MSERGKLVETRWKPDLSWKLPYSHSQLFRRNSTISLVRACVEFQVTEKCNAAGTGESSLQLGPKNRT